MDSYECGFQFEGSRKGLAKAESAVLELQEELSAASGGWGCDYPVKFIGDGKSMSWFYYSSDERVLEELPERVKKVARRTRLTLFVYLESVGERFDSTVEVWRRSVDADGYACFPAAVGMECAMALLNWRQNPTAKDLAILASGLDSALRTGCFEDPMQGITAAAQLRAEIVQEALRRDLFSDLECRRILLSLKEGFELTREAMDSEELPYNCESIYAVDYECFDARLEEIELRAAIAAGAGAPSKAEDRIRL